MEVPTRRRPITQHPLFFQATTLVTLTICFHHSQLKLSTMANLCQGLILEILVSVVCRLIREEVDGVPLPQQTSHLQRTLGLDRATKAVGLVRMAALRTSIAMP